MKRLALSVLGGFLIPFIYAIIFGPLSTYIENRTVNWLLGLPVRWPMILLERLFFLDLLILEDEFLIVVYIIVTDVALLRSDLPSPMAILETKTESFRTTGTVTIRF